MPASAPRTRIWISRLAASRMQVAKLSVPRADRGPRGAGARNRSEEHTSELQSLMRISYAVFCLKEKKKRTHVFAPSQRRYYADVRHQEHELASECRRSPVDQQLSTLDTTHNN